MNAVLRTAAADRVVGRTTNAMGSANALGTQWTELFEGVDDLIHRVADAENPEIRKSRAKMYAAMVIARNALEQRAKQAPTQLAQFGDRTRDDLPAYSTQPLGVSLLLGLGLGLIVSLDP